jgi:hypothetical protein
VHQRLLRQSHLQQTAVTTRGGAANSATNRSTDSATNRATDSATNRATDGAANRSTDGATDGATDHGDVQRAFFHVNSLKFSVEFGSKLTR